MKKYLAELIGTFVLVLMGCGSAALAAAPQAGAIGLGIGFAGVSLAFGLAVLSMVYAIGGVSGCHINPAITVAMLTANKITAKDAVMYIIFQTAGAVLGAALLAYIVGHGTALAVNSVDPYGLGYTMTQALVTEIAMTFIFLLVIFGATSDKSPAGFAGIAIGLCLTLIHLVSIPVTNTSVNPARSFGPALLDMVSGGKGAGMTDLWIFIVGPIVGGILAALVWKCISSSSNEA